MSSEGPSPCLSTWLHSSSSPACLWCTSCISCHLSLRCTWLQPWWHIDRTEDTNVISIMRLYRKYCDVPYLIWWFLIVDPSLHWYSWGSSIKYWELTQNYLLPITHKQMDRQRGWIRSWSNIWGCLWITAKWIGWSGWQLPNSHIIIKFKNQLKISPFYANYGFNPWMGFKPWWDMKVQAVDKFVDELKKIQEEAKVALCKACDDMKCFADWMHAHAPEYKGGDQVWLSTKILISRVKHRCRSTCGMQLTGLTDTGMVAKMPYPWDTIPISAVSWVLMVSLSYPDTDVAGWWSTIKPHNFKEFFPPIFAPWWLGL